jgi:hypothetical protein
MTRYSCALMFGFSQSAGKRKIAIDGMAADVAASPQGEETR